jgi:hypothetical protein
MKELVKEFQEKENPKRASLGSLGANQRINQLASPVKGRIRLIADEGDGDRIESKISIGNGKAKG